MFAVETFRHFTKRWVKIIFTKFGLILLKKESFDILISGILSRHYFDLLLISKFRTDLSGKLLHELPNSKSQLRQDLFVLGVLGMQKNGFFVEFGATNGVNINNTFMLESRFDWRGILAEPARIWHETLKKNRPNAQIDLRCVWKNSGENVGFEEKRDPEFSKILDSSTSKHRSFFGRKQQYEVETISLNDLLKFHSAPYEIDYLSIDTEGSELDIIMNFDFNNFLVKVITIEHNYLEAKSAIEEVLFSKGFIQVFSDVSRYESWFINRKIISKVNQNLELSMI